MQKDLQSQNVGQGGSSEITSMSTKNAFKIKVLLPAISGQLTVWIEGERVDEPMKSAGSFPLHHWMALLLLSHHPINHSFHPCSPFHLRPSPLSPHHGEEKDQNCQSARQGLADRYRTQSLSAISSTWTSHSFPPSPPASVTQSLSVVNLSSHLLPFKSVIAACYRGGTHGKRRARTNNEPSETQSSSERFCFNFALMQLTNRDLLLCTMLFICHTRRENTSTDSMDPDEYIKKSTKNTQYINTYTHKHIFMYFYKIVRQRRREAKVKMNKVAHTGRC